MPCSEEELMARIDGEAEENVKDCLEASVFDIEHEDYHSTLQRDLLQILFRCRCPSSMTLGDYHLGLLTEAEATVIEAHLAECPYCPAELEDLSQFLLEFS